MHFSLHNKKKLKSHYNLPRVNIQMLNIIKSFLATSRKKLFKFIEIFDFLSRTSKFIHKCKCKCIFITYINIFSSI